MAFVCHMQQFAGCVFIAEFIAGFFACSVAGFVIMSLLQTQRAFIVELTADLCSFLKSIGTVCDHAHGCSRTMEHRTG